MAAPSNSCARALILLGAPGAGKGTQATELSRRLGIPHISTGNILRENMAQGTPLGLRVKDVMNRGELVSDALVNELVRGRLRESDCRRGFLLDGYPRTVAQAEELKVILGELEACEPVVVNLRVSYDVIVERSRGRLTCPTCQRTYNLRYQPPLHDRVCDVDSTPLVERADDRPEAVRERLAVYERQTAPLIGYYRREGLLLEVDGEHGPAEVTDEVCRLLPSV